MLETLTQEQQHSSGVYVKRDLEIVRGEGAILWDSNGNRYIDCVGGQGAANLGHAHPAVVNAVQEQVATLMSCPELFQNPVRADYQARLCNATGMERVYLCNSGAEAVEAAIKFAVVSTGRSGIISMMRGFHGRTIGSLSTTWNKHYRQPFTDLVPDVNFVPFGNLERLGAALDETIAAVIIEPIQGEGGVHPADLEYLQDVQELCHTNRTLLIVDEIQTGFGRTGSIFAFQEAGIQPDLLCLAKSMGGGIPMGAVLLNEEMPPAIHGSTFGGNPIACAAGIAVLDVLENSDLVEGTRQRGHEVLTYLQEKLSQNIVREVRGQGLMIGIELRTKVAPFLQELQERGVLALPAGATVLRLLPPLIIEDEDLWQALETIVEVLNNAAE